MRKDQKQVVEFHKLFAGTSAGCPCPDKFTEMGSELLKLRARLILEEALEFAQACSFTVTVADDGETQHGVFLDETGDPPNYAEMIDALCDIKYVANGAACAMGVDLQPFEDEVHRSNMAKADGGIRVREDGKILKPDGWRPPDIAGILERIRADTIETKVAVVRDERRTSMHDTILDLLWRRRLGDQDVPVHLYDIVSAVSVPGTARTTAVVQAVLDDLVDHEPSLIEEVALRAFKITGTGVRFVRNGWRWDRHDG